MRIIPGKIQALPWSIRADPIVEFHGVWHEPPAQLSSDNPRIREKNWNSASFRALNEVFDWPESYGM